MHVTMFHHEHGAAVVTVVGPGHTGFDLHFHSTGRQAVYGSAVLPTGEIRCSTAMGPDLELPHVDDPLSGVGLSALVQGF